MSLDLSETGGPPLPEAVCALLGGLPGGAGRILGQELLQGDASDRAYSRVRVQSPDGSEPHSFVLMQLAGPWVPEFGREEIPFVNVARHLREKGIPVPGILADAARQGFLLLEDVGDCTLEAYLRQCSAQERERGYREAVEILVRIQQDATRPSRLPCCALSSAFDARTFFRELEFFREFALEGLWGNTISPLVRRELQRQFRVLCEQISACPQVFVHRDYHARNLMVHNGCLRVLDFQDARLGPVTYDLASLLRDSYVRLSEREEGALEAWYLERARAAGLRLPGPEEWRVWFLRTVVQRNLKALGTFAYQHVAKGVDRYLSSIPNTVSSMSMALEEFSEFSILRELLVDMVEGLQAACRLTREGACVNDSAPIPVSGPRLVKQIS